MSSGKDQFRKVFSKIRAAVNDLELDTLPEIAEVIRSRIQSQARAGKTMKSGTLEKIKALSPGYVKQRKKWRSRGKELGDVFSPARSNLTVTGQYLDSIKTKSIEKKTATITVGVTGGRKGEKLTNAKLAEYLGMQGRSIWGIDNVTRKRITNMVKADIRNAIRRNLLKK